MSNRLTPYQIAVAEEEAELRGIHGRAYLVLLTSDCSRYSVIFPLVLAGAKLWRENAAPWKGYVTVTAWSVAEASGRIAYSAGLDHGDIRRRLRTLRERAARRERLEGRGGRWEVLFTRKKLIIRTSVGGVDIDHLETPYGSGKDAGVIDQILRDPTALRLLTMLKPYELMGPLGGWKELRESGRPAQEDLGGQHTGDCRVRETEGGGDVRGPGATPVVG